MTELNKFGVIGLLHFHKEILQSHFSEFPFQKLQYIQKGKSCCIKNLCNLSNKIFQYLVVRNYRGAKEEV